MEKLYASGAVRAIGVSNFSAERLVDLCMNQEVKPMVNQIELHPFYQQAEALKVWRFMALCRRPGAVGGSTETHL